MTERLFIILIMVMQAIGLTFFAGQTFISLLGISMRPLPWEVQEALEIIASGSLILGLTMGAYLLRKSIKQRNRVQKALASASSSFEQVIDARFTEWGLSEAEKDVALFAIKGMNTAEIADLRNTSDGTVKAQSAQVYRKAGVNSRAQLLSLFVEDLFDENLVKN